MGHADSDVTDRYTHRTETSLLIAAEMLERFRTEQKERLEKLRQKPENTAVDFLQQMSRLKMSV